jgi:hypothetical protein
VRKAASRGNSSKDLIENLFAPLAEINVAPCWREFASEKKLKSMRIDSSRVSPSVAGDS